MIARPILLVMCLLLIACGSDEMLMHKIDLPLELRLEKLGEGSTQAIEVSVDCVFDIDQEMRSDIEATGATILAVEDDYARVRATPVQIARITQIDNVFYIKLPKTSTSVD